MAKKSTVKAEPKKSAESGAERTAYFKHDVKISECAFKAGRNYEIPESWYDKFIAAGWIEER